MSQTRSRHVPEAALLDLSQEIHAYFYGLALTDGSLSESQRNRGKLQIELASRDEAVLLALAAEVPFSSTFRRRSRTTNFGTSFTSTLSFHGYELRNQLKAFGFPIGRKSSIITVPQIPDLHEVGFWRGVVDGDGSLGLTSQGKPYVSLVTASDDLAAAFKAWVFRATGAWLGTNKNVRDRVFNLVIGGRKCTNDRSTNLRKQCHLD